MHIVTDVWYVSEYGFEPHEWHWVVDVKSELRFIGLVGTRSITTAFIVKPTQRQIRRAKKAAIKQLKLRK